MPSNQIWFGLASQPLEQSFLDVTQNSVMHELLQFGHILSIWNNDQKVGYVWEYAPFQAYSDGPWKSERPAYHFWMYMLPEYTSLKKAAVQAYLDLHAKGLFFLHTLPEYQDAGLYQKQFGFKKVERNTNHIIFRRDAR